MATSEQSSKKLSLEIKSEGHQQKGFKILSRIRTIYKNDQHIYKLTKYFIEYRDENLVK